MTYGVRDVIFDGLEGRLDTLRWTADAASLGSAWLRTTPGGSTSSVNRIEMSSGVMLTRADSGVEIVSPHVSLSEMKLTVRGPFGRSSRRAGPRTRVPPDAPADAAPGQAAVPRQPVGPHQPDGQGRPRSPGASSSARSISSSRSRSQDGSLDFRALEESLDWLEGAFLDITHDKDKLALKWKVPIVGGGARSDRVDARRGSRDARDVRSRPGALARRRPPQGDARHRSGGSVPEDDKRKTCSR